MSAPFKLIIAAGVIGVTVAAGITISTPPPDTTELAMLPPATFAYRAAGDHRRDGQPVNPPLVSVAFDRPVAIMKHHVSRADYQRCVVARACKPIAANTPSNGDQIPAVGVSWFDATAYAGWLSSEIGRHYRLPTDAEWAYAAGSLFHDNTIVAEGDAANPSKRWIATYESLAATDQPVDSRPQPFGTYGINENGLADVAGNVWDWTTTCFARYGTGADGPVLETESCGVRVVEGRHRTYLTDFIRDAKGGACSVGTPPNNLGIRLVRDEDGGWLDRLAAGLRRVAFGA